MIDLARILKDGANLSLRMLNQDKLHIQLADIIACSYGNDEAFLSDLHNIEHLARNYDYRLIAVYLWALKNNKKQLLQIFKQMFMTNKSSLMDQYLYQLAYQRFEDGWRENKTFEVLFAKTIDEIFIFKNRGVLIYFYDNAYKKDLMTLLDNLGSSLGDFIEQQYDIPGRNAVVRQGVVKGWTLPNGVLVVSKRQNLSKLDKFRREQLNYCIIHNDVSKSSFFLNDPVEYGQKIHVQIAHPFALINDGYTGVTYALFKKMPGDTLEEILYEEEDKAIRAKYLLHYRLILEELYNRGILWGDMSPRNILVHQQKDMTKYTLVDFEKTTVIDRPIPSRKRIEHCRGQIFIEELCVVCPLEEVIKIFEKYFNPSRWDTKSTRDLSFEPRSDIVNLLRGRGITNITMGEYNTLDKKIIGIRKPYWNSRTKRFRFPGTIGFKVEHYLSCIGDKDASEYDRKTTEILLAAKEQNCFNQVVDLLLDKAGDLESALLKLEFLTILERGFLGDPPKPYHEAKSLKRTLDNFYEHRNLESSYIKLIETITQTGIREGN